MVSCKLDSHALLLRPRVRSGNPVTLDNFSFSVPYTEFDNSYFHFLTRRRSTNEDE